MPNGQSITPILTDKNSVQELNPNGGAVTNQEPTLKQTGDAQRASITSFNEYKNVPNQGYSKQHPNAQSDGDDEGRGEVGPGQGVGTSDDKVAKTTLLYNSGNKYKPGTNYYNFTYTEQYW